MNVRLFFILLTLAASVAVPILVRHHAAAELRLSNEVLRHQTALLAEATAEHTRLTNLLAGVKASQALSGPELTELLRLRNEVGQLRHSLKESDRLANESERMRQAIKDSQAGIGKEEPLALLADVMELRKARLAQLNQWLETHPGERIPELRMLSEEHWIRTASWQRVTDEEYRRWMSRQRGNAIAQFSLLAFKALKAYAQANNGQFPTDLSQLQPLFEMPIEEAILQRYMIVPASSLASPLSRADSNWVITEKAPVNAALDARVAVGLKGRITSLESNRWGNAP